MFYLGVFFMSAIDDYRRQRKRERDRQYRLRKKGIDISAKDLPPIPEDISEEDISILEDVAQSAREQGIFSYEQKIEDDYANEEFLGKEYEQQLLDKEDLQQYVDWLNNPNDESAYFSQISAITQRLTTKITNMIYGNTWLQKTGGYLKLTRSSKSVVPYDTSDDQNSLIERWTEVLEKADDLPPDEAANYLENLDQYISDNEDLLSKIINDMEEITYSMQQYQTNLNELYKILSYETPTTRDDYRTLENDRNRMYVNESHDIENMPTINIPDDLDYLKGLDDLE